MESEREVLHVLWIDDGFKRENDHIWRELEEVKDSLAKNGYETEVYGYGETGRETNDTGSRGGETSKTARIYLAATLDGAMEALEDLGSFKTRNEGAIHRVVAVIDYSGCIYEVETGDGTKTYKTWPECLEARGFFEELWKTAEDARIISYSAGDMCNIRKTYTDLGIGEKVHAYVEKPDYFSRHETGLPNEIASCIARFHNRGQEATSRRPKS